MATFFGALALTPGRDAKTNPSDDGFLTLAEVYELNLKGSELAILSAVRRITVPSKRVKGSGRCRVAFWWPAHGGWWPAIGWSTTRLGPA